VKVDSFLIVFSGLFGFPRFTPIKVVPIGFRSVLQPFGYAHHQIEPFLLQTPVAQAVESTHPPNNPLLEGSQIAGLRCGGEGIGIGVEEDTTALT
jgi:hypothetical protein